MRRILITGMLLLSAVTYGTGGSLETQGGMVYICTGSSSKRYHSSAECRGLSNCQGTIAKVSLEKARGMGRTPCKICY